MIGSNYKAHRDNVLDIYEGYLKKRAEFDSSMGSNEGDGVDSKFLEKRIENLRKSKFTVAVAGEVKAGKSTFINALLGVELLPSDVLQATNAIVEIFKWEKPQLKVKYADGHEEEIDDELDKIKERLCKICKISDEFEDTPTTQIDELIANSDTKPECSDELIKELEKNRHLVYPIRKNQ